MGGKGTQLDNGKGKDGDGNGMVGSSAERENIC